MTDPSSTHRRQGAGSYPDAFEYAAFISYAHEDRDWAIRLLTWLKRYKSPAALRKQGVRERLGEIFRDESHLAASHDLSTEIKEALGKSEFLIVICSPHAAQSHWVGKEVEAFQQQGRGDKILTLLVAGEPDTSIPAGLLTTAEPLYADMRNLAGERRGAVERRAFLLLAAALLDQSYDALEQPDRRARRRQMMIAAAAGIAAVVVATWWWDDNYRVKVTYCAGYGERWGMPFCAVEIGEDQARTRTVSYRFTAAGSTLQSMEQVDGRGLPVTAPETEYPQEAWTYGAARWVIKSPALLLLQDDKGRPLRQIAYTFHSDNPQEAVAVIYDSRPGRPAGTANWQAATGTALGTLRSGRRFALVDDTPSAKIGQHRLSFGPDGLLQSRMFEILGTGAPASDAGGVYGRSYRYDARGLPVEIRNLDASRQAWADATGAASLDLAWDPDAMLSRAAWTDADGKPAKSKEYFHSVEFERDRFRNISSRRTFDENRKLYPARTTGIAVTRFRRDSHGADIESTYFDLNENPANILDEGFHKVEIVRNENGDLKEERYFNQIGTPTAPKGGVFRSRLEKIGDDKILYFYNSAGNPVAHPILGTESVKISFDDEENIVGVAGFDKNGLPAGMYKTPIHRMDTVNKVGASAVKAPCRDINLPLIFRSSEIKFLNSGGFPTNLERIGGDIEIFYFGERNNVVAESYARDEGSRSRQFILHRFLDHDDRGQLRLSRYFGEDCKPSMHPVGKYFGVEYTYDKRGNIVREAYYDSDGKRVINREFGFHEVTREFDRHGNMIGEAFFGTDRAPVLNSENFSRVEYSFDVYGRITNKKYHGQAGVDISGKRASSENYYYNSVGNKTTTTYLDSRGRPVLGPDGFYAEMQEYDSSGRLRSVAFSDTSGRFTIKKGELFSIKRTKYDNDGNVTEEAYFDADEKKTLGGRGGFFRNSIKYDKYSRTSELSYFGSDEKPVIINGAHRTTHVYNDEENTTETRRYDKNNNPIFGTHRIKYKSNKFGYDIREEYFNGENKPVIDAEKGFARVDWQRDKRNRITETTFFGTDGKLLAGPDGWAIRRTQYDNRDLLTMEAFFDTAGKPVEALQQAAHRIDSAYNEAGKIAEQIRFATDGRVTRRPEHPAWYRAGYDGAGNLTQEAWFDADGKPAAGPSGVAVRKSLFDQRGRVTEISVFGIDAKPQVDRTLGCARVAMRYDDQGYRIDYACYGVDRKLAMGSGGYARQITRYDDQGRLAEQTNLDMNEKPVVVRGPWAQCARTSYRYDDQSGIVESSCFGSDGRPATDRPAREIDRYDDRQNLVESGSYDSGGKPTADDGGCARTTFSYDVYDREIRRNCFAATGKPGLNKSGVAQEIRRYTDRGQIAEEIFLGINGGPPATRVSKIVHHYDQDGLFTNTVAYGFDGNVVDRGDTLFPSTVPMRRF